VKKLAVASMAIVVALLSWSLISPSHAQAQANEEKPTFYRLTPGVYVNGWPRFTVTYPKDWVERLPFPPETFRAEAPGRKGTGEMFVIVISPSSQPLEKQADIQINFFKNIAKAKDVTLVSNKPSRLRDGTPAQEFQLQMILGAPVNWLTLATKKGDMSIEAEVGGPNVRIGEDLKAIAYSLEFQPGKDEPVKLPPDVQEFLDKWCSALVAHDLAKVMIHYSDRFLDSGDKKGEVERFWRQIISLITSYEVGITDFEAAGDRAYLAGFSNFNMGKWPQRGTSIIKENGEWKWYGNQRDVSP
jgi:hypothetical protein